MPMDNTDWAAFLKRIMDSLDPCRRHRNLDRAGNQGLEPAMAHLPKSSEILHDKILIVDFGSQVTQLIARRVREEGVYSEIVPFQKADEAFAKLNPKAVILSGGPESVHEAGSPRAPEAIFKSGVPVLGICYGQMTMAHQLGGMVEGGHHREYGRADVEVKARQPICSRTTGMSASAIRCG